MSESGKGCVICGGEEKDGELLVAAPCGRHWVCPDDIISFFERATQNESLFPPKCCGQMFMLQEYEDYIPFDTAWAYQVKEQGEYAILAKFRVYCGNPRCGKFLQPSAHVTDQATKITYAICEDDACGKLTCIGCKNVLDEGTQNHICKKNENEEKFLQIAKENGYQECRTCGATVELAEACNHISCSCGFDFCYLCGKEWMGPHGCPHYGQATFDAEGYNQDGYHRETGLNREGLTRRQEMARRRGDDLDADEEDEGEEDDDEWEVMQHLPPEQRQAINFLHGQERDDALDNLRIQLFEERGILFGADPPPPPPAPNAAPTNPIQQQIMTQIAERLDAADENPIMGALLQRLLHGNLDAPTATQVIHRIAKLQAESIGPQLAAQAIHIFAVAGHPWGNLANDNEEQYAQFIQHLTQHLTDLAAQTPAAAEEQEPSEGKGDDAAPDNDENAHPNEHDADSDIPEFEVDSERNDPLTFGDVFTATALGIHHERSTHDGHDNEPDSDDMPGLHDPETPEAELTSAEATRLHYQNYQAAVEDGAVTQESEDAPKIPGLEAGGDRFWGLPGDWPRGGEDL